MARTKGTLPLSANLEPQIAAPLDARDDVPTLAELYLTATWTAKDGNVYTYVGLKTGVSADGTNNGSYMLIAADYTQPASWLRIGSDETYSLALSDVTSNLTTGVKDTTYWPYNFTLVDLFIGVGVAPVGSKIIVDVKNNSGVSIFSTLVSIDENEYTSLTASVPYILTTTSFAKGDKVTFEVTLVGATTAGKSLKIFMNGIKS